MKRTADTLMGEYLEVRGNTRLLADGYHKLLCYESEKITLAGKRHSITVTGKKLEMKYLTGEKIGIEGYIRGIEYGKADS